MGIKPNNPEAAGGSPDPIPTPIPPRHSHGIFPAPLTHHVHHLLPAPGVEQRVGGDNGGEEQQRCGASGPGALGTHLGGDSSALSPLQPPPEEPG